MTAKRLKRRRDPVQLGKLVGDILTGQVEDRQATPHYNFVRIHQTLKITPAMAAGVTGKLWEMFDMVKVLEDWEAAQKVA